MRAQEFLRTNRVGFSVSADDYDLALDVETLDIQDAFAIVHHRGRYTVIGKKRKGRYRLLTFEVKLPQDLIGFLALVTDALAQVDVPVFVISSFETDHILIPREDLSRAVEALEGIGMEHLDASSRT
ncbi:MAG: ACT domain-containing protein [Methanomassiliicoccales archaeon]|nr:ACT domain-containing protein [Methanomassiliicoccales archaeon]